MSTDPRTTPPEDDPSDGESDADVEFADTANREETDATFREKGREIMRRFRDAFASLAE